ncbi:MAG: adenylate/guanylate cyclase domain-containing protein [Nitratireductor sp.]|jgi:adenylate cyclase|nr:adenylate/guanylate cyclase domain-containing protein [Nitratireductor sp.]
MSERRVERRLAAILAADIVGYSRMMGADEAGTLGLLRELRANVLDPAVSWHHGRLVKVMGDGALVEFASVVDAVNCAVAIQESLAAFNSERVGKPPIAVRIGVNLGDVIIEGKDIFGDGVNVAARLQQIAEPGQVVLSGTAYEHSASKVKVEFADGGEQTLKNIARPVRVWRWPQSGGASPASGAEAVVLPDKPSIAVLPFDNMSGDREQEYLADGVVEAITAALSRIRSFFVIARNSAFTYKGRAKNVREIGRELGVAYLLEGSFQRAGERVRITVQLIETASGAHLWAERYDGRIDDIFDLQDRITEQVAGAMQPSIRLAEVERARRKPPQELGAYDYTMRALHHVWMLEKYEAAKGLELLEKALEIDPEYPFALALAAWCWAQRSVYNWTDDIPAAKARALALAEKAANLAHDDPLILAILGAVHTFGRSYGTARVLLERAIQLDPNAAWALSRLGWLEVYADRPQTARPYFERSIRLSPMDPMNFNNYVGIGSAWQVEGDDNLAAEYFLRALVERPSAYWIHRNLAPALLAVGREEEARKSLETLAWAYPNLSIKRFRDAMVFSPAVIERISFWLRKLGIPED